MYKMYKKLYEYLTAHSTSKVLKLILLHNEEIKKKVVNLCGL